MELTGFFREVELIYKWSIELPFEDWHMLDLTIDIESSYPIHAVPLIIDNQVIAIAEFDDPVSKHSPEELISTENLN